MQHEVVTAQVVTDDSWRLRLLPKYVGLPDMMRCEASVFDSVKSMCPQYEGGYWEMVETSNNAFFMYPRMKPARPDGKIEMQSMNGSTRDVTPEAAGLVGCLFAFNALVWRTRDDRHDDLFSNLLQYARGHAEWDAIAELID